MNQLTNILLARILVLVSFLGLVYNEVQSQNSEQYLKPIPRFVNYNLDKLIDSSSSNIGFLIIDDIQESTSYTDLYYHVFVELKYPQRSVLLPTLLSPFELKGYLTVKGKDAISGTVDSYSDSITLNISPYKDYSLEVFRFDRANYPFNLKDIDSIGVSFDLSQLDQIDSSLYQVLETELRVDIGRYYEYDYDSLKVQFHISDTSDPGNSLKVNEAILSWDDLKGPVLYEVELLHIPSTNPTSNDRLDLDFTSNASRFQTTRNYIPINLLYNSGHLVARYRIIRPLYNYELTALSDRLVYSSWSVPDSVLNYPANRLNVMQIGATSSVHSELNWQLTSIFQKNGIGVFSTNYFDGSGRKQQNTQVVSDFSMEVVTTDTISKYNSDVYFTESYYDYTGAEVIKMLVAPLLSSKDIGFQKEVNYLTNSEFIKKNNYDHDTTSAEPQLSENEEGPAKYYSSKNELLGEDSIIKYVPNANGFPFQRKVFAKDGSSRIIKDQKAGSTYALSEENNSRFIYTKPTESELNFLFGTNVGKVAFYKKNIEIDPNGLANVSYVDVNGRVVASAICGETLSRSGMIPVVDEEITFTDDLLSSGYEEVDYLDGTFKLTYPLFAPVTSIFELNYGFELEAYQACANASICFDCKYEASLQVLNDNNELIFEARDSIIELDQSSCDQFVFKLDEITYNKDNAHSITDSTINIELLALKSYTLVKELKLIKNHYAEYSNDFLEIASCNPHDYEYFVDKQLAIADFESCQTEYPKFSPFCDILEHELKQDFTYPGGKFVKNAPLDSIVPRFIYRELMKVSGCYEISDTISIDQFERNFNSYFGKLSGLRFSEYSNEYLDYLIRFHPTYCQLPLCRKYYSEESNRFDEMLTLSDSLAEFESLLKAEGIMDEQDEFLFDSLLYVKSNFLGTSDYDSLIFINYDSALAAVIDDSLYLSYKDSILGVDASFYNEVEYISSARNCVAPSGNLNFLNAIELAEYKHIALKYFRDFNGCNDHDTLSLPIHRIALLAPSTNNHNWKVYKQLYLSAKHAFYQDIINSTVCFYGKLDSSAGNPDIGYPRLPSDSNNCEVNGGEYYYPWIGGSDLVNYRNYDHHTHLKNALEEHLEVREIGFGDMVDSIWDLQIDYWKTPAIKIIELLMSEGCISSSADSTDFLNGINSELLFCDPYDHLAGITNQSGATIVSCNILQYDFSAYLKDYIVYAKDSTGGNLINCDSTYRGLYNYKLFKAAHDAFIVEYDSVSIPFIDSLYKLSINNTLQKGYKNWMNHHLGLNLSFNDYFQFASEFTPDSTLNLFGYQAIWTGDSIVGTYKERVKDFAKDQFVNKYTVANGYSEYAIIDSINKGLVDTIDRTIDIVQFGETNFSNHQNDLFYIDSGKYKIDLFLDTINAVYDDILAELQTDALYKIEDTTDSYAEQIISDYASIGSLSNLLIHKAYRYSNGTVWLRIVNKSDSSFYTDMYLHYPPYNGIYYQHDVDTFIEAKPIIYSDEINYLSLKVNEDIEVVFSTSRIIAKAENIGKVLLGDYISNSVYPFPKGCEDLKYQSAIFNAKINYQYYQDSLKGAFIQNYNAFCMGQGPGSAINNQYLRLTRDFSERQFTLYYYDQAGNLTMTVPPAGVNIDYTYDADSLDKINDYRNGISNNEVLPTHSKRTIYKYNADNQVVRQITPNSDTSYFWYDKAGRITLSQNAEQRLTNDYSYTLYDAQSRIQESGQVEINDFSDLDWGQIHATIVLEIFDSEVIQWDQFILDLNRTNVNKTYYDNPVLSSPPYGFTQKNLRSRVATQAFYNSLDTNSSIEDWTYAIHYSYDPIGNVTSLINDFYQNGIITASNYRFKRINYLFDEVSGNVLRVDYQRGEEDAFYHKYEYDGKNRLINVSTSTDGIIWDEDANYSYYPHGPLARIELANSKVQGLDYAYTLNGWLKSINGSHQYADIGSDFNKNNETAEDVFGSLIAYNDIDYQSIGDVNNLLIEDTSGIVFPQLYNGNIGGQVNHRLNATQESSDLAKAYTYDQLNRIRGSYEYEVDADSLVIGNSLSNENSTFYAYDKDGNLTSLDRVNGDSTALMDDLTYHYKSGTDQLTHVDDQIASTNFSNDLDQQTPNNYSYDKIGNLIADSSENICKISWYPNGKIKRIRRFLPTIDRPDLSFEYDPLGNRIRKSIHFIEEGKSYLRTTYYSRDPNGNVMATYEERDCDYYEGNDSTGLFYYQYSESYQHYASSAVSQLNDLSALIDFLNDDFSKKVEFKESAEDNLEQIPNIKDSIMLCLDDSIYFDLYPQAVCRILDYDPYSYTKYAYDSSLSSFIAIVNDRNEIWIQYLIETDSIQTFYGDIDHYYDSIYGSTSNYSFFYSMNKDFIDDIQSSQSLMSSYLDISEAEYNIIIDCINGNLDQSEELDDFIDSLDKYVALEDVSNSTKYIEIINAMVLALDFSSTDIGSALSIANLSSYYTADSYLSSVSYDRLCGLLYHMHCINSSYVDIGELNQYKPSSSINWTNDVSGSYLKYFLNPIFSNNKVVDLFDNYFGSSYFKQYDIYFEDSTTVHAYIKSSIARNCDSTYFRDLLELQHLHSTTYDNIYASEGFANLAHYYKLNCPYQLIIQHYYYDTLYSVFSDLHHFSPLDLAYELSEFFDPTVDFGPLGGCSPHQVYLVPEQHHIYGSDRLGIRNSNMKNRDTESKFSRKLSAKEYEIKDHLGNVVATVSDKKLHPQELVDYGSHDFDTSIGYQAQLTGTYDYYPFGMEIMGRSGSFNTIDYTKDIEVLSYRGKLNDCADYAALNSYVNTSDSVFCVKDTNIYRQEFIDTIRIDHTDCCWAGRHKFDFSMDIDLNEVIPNLDTSAQYQLDFEMVAQGRHIVINEPGNGSWSTANYTGAAQIRRDSIKTLSIFYSGKQLDSMANNGVLEIEFKISWGESGYPFTAFAEMFSLDIYEIHENTSVPISKRNALAYNYGFNGYEREDALSGSGNAYDFGARIYSSRLGKFFSTDPREADFPYWSPYLFAANIPIRYIDINGEGPGDRFKSADEAAIDFGKTYNSKSIKKDREYGSIIIKVVDGDDVYYTYVKATKGKKTSVEIKLRGHDKEDIVADVHTHASATIEDYMFPTTNDNFDENENFSEGDKQGNTHEEHVGYLITPGGSVKKFTPPILDGVMDNKIPADGKVEVIDTESVPSDPDSPSRVNTIDPD